MSTPGSSKPSTAAGHSMRFGARLRADGGVDFNLWAPQARSAAVLYRHGAEEGQLDCLQATSEPGGWWHAHIEDATAHTRYQWQINDSLRVPDPAAREAPHGPHGLCRVTEPSRYSWHRPDWRGLAWEELVFYELHIGTFTPAGTYEAAAAELPRLADLGFTAIELMPLATFGGQWGWGYDGVLPFASRALLVILEIRALANEAVPMFGGLAGLRFQLLNLCRSQGRGFGGWGRGRVEVFRFGVLMLFAHR